MCNELSSESFEAAVSSTATIMLFMGIRAQVHCLMGLWISGIVGNAFQPQHAHSNTLILSWFPLTLRYTPSASVCPRTLTDQTELELWAPLMLSEICSLFSLSRQTTAPLPKTRLSPFYTLLSTVLPFFPSNPASSPEAGWLDKQTDQNKHAELRHAHSFTAQTKYRHFAVWGDTLYII